MRTFLDRDEEEAKNVWAVIQAVDSGIDAVDKDGFKMAGFGIDASRHPKQMAGVIAVSRYGERFRLHAPLWYHLSSGGCRPSFYQLGRGWTKLHGMPACVWTLFVTACARIENRSQQTKPDVLSHVSDTMRVGLEQGCTLHGGANCASTCKILASAHTKRTAARNTAAGTTAAGSHRICCHSNWHDKHYKHSGL